MSERKNIFTIHSWENADAFDRMKRMLDARVAGLADYSVPPRKALVGSSLEIAQQLYERIRFASVVVVHNTRDLHKRPTSSYEVEVAHALNKRIIVVQPHDDFSAPISERLDQCATHIVPWNSEVVGKAIQGTLKDNGVTFDIAEVTDRRRLIQTVALGAGVLSFTLLVRDIKHMRKLEKEFGNSGLIASWDGVDWGKIATASAIGAGLGYVVGLLGTKDAKSALTLAALGAVLGGTAEGHRQYRASIVGTEGLRVITLDPA